MLKSLSQMAMASASLPLSNGRWSRIFSNPERLASYDVKLIQEALIARGYDLGRWGADGVFGLFTEKAYRAYVAESKSETSDNHPRPFPKDTVEAINNFYGRIVNGQPPRQTYIEPPYPMVLAWQPETKLRRIRCHELIAKPLERALAGVLERLGSEGIKKYELDHFGGTTIVRLMRGGSELSRHSWGIAIDLSPVQNALGMRRDEATMPVEAIEAFAEQGFINLGCIKGKGYDYMHFQATRIPDDYCISA